jgi:hypothetical protein
MESSKNGVDGCGLKFAKITVWASGDRGLVDPAEQNACMSVLLLLHETEGQNSGPERS